jgi:hypothetical protein
MPGNSDLAAAASAISNAGQIIASIQVRAHVPNVQDEDARTLLRRIFEILEHQNEALESLTSAIEKLNPESRGLTYRRQFQTK